MKWLTSLLPSFEIGTMIQMALRTIVYHIDQIVYEFIIKLYNFFRIICNARLSGNGIMGELATRIGLILGLVMFFYVTFDFIQILIDPDKMQDKEKGPINIIKKFIIVIVLLGTSSFIFDALYRFQEAVLSPDSSGTSVIEKLILPYDINSDNFGAAISSNFMAHFYKITSDEEAEDAEVLEEGFTYSICKKNAEQLPNRIATTGTLYTGFFCLNARYKSLDGARFYIDFNLLSLIVGIVVAWMLIMYCISVGIRVIQLTFLEIISPVAIVSYLSPKKDSMFSKFWKIYFATYVDVFIRIAIINFVVLLSGLILDFEDHGFWESLGNPSGDVKFWISVFMILGLLSFAKKAPDLIKQFLPDKVASGLSFGISPKDRAGLGMIGGTLAGAATGFAGGAVGGAMNGKGVVGKIGGTVSGAVTGTAGGVVRGATAGWKGKDLRESVTNANKNQSAANLRKNQRIASGQTFVNAFSDSIRTKFGIEAGGATDTRTINTLQSYVSLQDTIEGYADNNSEVKALKRDYENIQQAGRMQVEATDSQGNVLKDQNGQIIYRDETDAEFAGRVEAARQRYKNAQHSFITAVADDENSFKYINTKGEEKTMNFSVDDFNVSNIKAGIKERNRLQDENKNIFKDYQVGVKSYEVPAPTSSDPNRREKVTAYDSMDKNTNRARNEIARRSAKRRRENKR